MPLVRFDGDPGIIEYAHRLVVGFWLKRDFHVGHMLVEASHDKITDVWLRSPDMRLSYYVMVGINAVKDAIKHKSVTLREPFNPREYEAPETHWLREWFDEMRPSNPKGVAWLEEHLYATGQWRGSNSGTGTSGRREHKAQIRYLLRRTIGPDR